MELNEQTIKNMQGNAFMCANCHSISNAWTTGKSTGNYGISHTTGLAYCPSCCAQHELATMLKTGKGCLYDCETKLTDWAGKLVFPVLADSYGDHNWAGSRHDVWFKVPSDPFVWHGVCYGQNTMLCHVSRTKQTQL